MEEIKHNLSGPLYNMYFGSYEEIEDFKHSKKGTTWAKHKYIRKEGNKYIYANTKGNGSGSNSSSGKFRWKNEYSNDLKKYKYDTISMPGMGKVHIYVTEDGTINVLHPGYAKYVLPKGSDLEKIKSRLNKASESVAYMDKTDSASHLTNERARLAGQNIMDYDLKRYLGMEDNIYNAGTGQGVVLSDEQRKKMTSNVVEDSSARKMNYNEERHRYNLEKDGTDDDIAKVQDKHGRSDKEDNLWKYGNYTFSKANSDYQKSQKNKEAFEEAKKKTEEAKKKKNKKFFGLF